MSNRLREENSPYLLQHAQNPVDWYPWGPEAFERALQEDRPVFLSVGYAACHWCHVMEHESFEDPATAELMNTHFVNVKVDREERPDIDSIYMDAVVAMTGQGGWPMSLFLSPNGVPFYGGTYFPPERRFNMPSFPELLESISSAWRNDRERLLENGQQIVEQLSARSGFDSPEGGLDPGMLDSAAKTLFQGYDWSHGGWGGAPKFPQATSIGLLLQLHRRKRDVLARDMAIHALQSMAAAGIHDQLGGGFHRYAVDGLWLIPHFEKMLYDNALLAKVYLNAWQVTGQEALRTVAEGILDFLLREMQDPQGGFYSSLDADSEGHEGKYYVWRPEEIHAAIEDPISAQIVISSYGISEEGNFEGASVLYQASHLKQISEELGLSDEETIARLEAAEQKLLGVRAQRVTPDLDDKVLTSWNGLALIAFAEAAGALGRDDYLQVAQRLAAFLLEHLLIEHRLFRSWRKDKAQHLAYLEDHAALGLGLLGLYQVDFNARWYQAAVQQAHEILNNFTDPQGGFYDTGHDHEQLIRRPKSLQDSPTPSGNTLAVWLLLQLASLTGESRYSNPAETAVAAMQALAARHPSMFAGWLSALDFSLGPQIQLALVGNPLEPDFQALVEIARSGYYPHIVLAGAPPGSPGVPPLLSEREMQGDRATAYLCQGFSCNLPTVSPIELKKQIDEALS